MTATRKFYALIPSAFSYRGEPYWLELHETKTLKSAQHYADRHLGGLTNTEISMSVNGGDKTVVSKKNKDGVWEVVPRESDTAAHSENDQVQYYLDNGVVSKEEFFKYGFQRGK